jgi:multidrug efflux system membrane fusion protein
MTGQRSSGLIGSVIRATQRPRVALIAAGLILLVIVAVHGASDVPSKSDAPPKSGASAPGAPQSVRVETALAARRDVPIYLEGLGTVQAYYTVTITPRVDGELLSLGFTEGQVVKPGDVLAQIDARPYQAALDQAAAMKAKDTALLENARRDLARYISLAPEEFTSEQTLETQRSLVAQLEAQLVADQAAIDNAKTQLSYTTIRSPIYGRTGIRLTDPGNIVHAATSTGIVVVTQVQPISVIFTLPADSLASVRQAMASGPLPVTAISRDGKNLLGSGRVELIDNQIDQATGTMRLKAKFPNKDSSLWPGDFVNARVLVQTRHDALTIPSTAVQRGPDGVFAFVVTPDATVEKRPLKVGEESTGVALVEKGLTEGERVTTNNAYRLQPGSRVLVLDSSAPTSVDIGKRAP